MSAIAPLLKIMGHLNPSKIPYTTKSTQAKKLILLIYLMFRGKKDSTRMKVAIYPITSVLSFIKNVLSIFDPAIARVLLIL